MMEVFDEQLKMQAAEIEKACREMEELYTPYFEQMEKEFAPMLKDLEKVMEGWNI